MNRFGRRIQRPRPVVRRAIRQPVVFRHRRGWVADQIRDAWQTVPRGVPIWPDDCRPGPLLFDDMDDPCATSVPYAKNRHQSVAGDRVGWSDDQDRTPTILLGCSTVYGGSPKEVVVERRPANTR